MKIVIEDRGEEISHRIRERIASAERLRCTVHGQAVEALTIHGRENGWFDTQWTTCCETLERTAAAIVKTRC